MEGRVELSHEACELFTEFSCKKVGRVIASDCRQKCDIIHAIHAQASMLWISSYNTIVCNQITFQ